MTCPVCHSEAEGRFCANCGASLGPQRCDSCGAEVKAGSLYCQLCGKKLTGGARNRALPWVVAGGMVAALSAVLLVRLTSAPRATRADAAGPPPVGTAMQAPDISNMSPRERADRLFNRVMSAAERGDTGEVAFFVPMALQSYALLGPLDADARYHVGAIQLASHNYPAALTDADSLGRAVPGHLLASVLRAQVAIARNDNTARNRAYRDFLAAYDREMAAGRAEYAEHRGVLDQTHDDARRAVAGK